MLNIILIDNSIYFHEDMLAKIGLRDFCPVNIIASLTDGYDPSFLFRVICPRKHLNENGKSSSSKSPVIKKYQEHVYRLLVHCKKDNR